jgi:hypothetical protein
MLRGTVIACALVSIVSFAARSEVQQPDRNYAASSNPHIRLFASVLKDSVWTSRSIFVCWENLESVNADPAAMVRAAVSRTWEKQSAVRFIGWETCAAENAGIRIRIEDSGPHTKGLGRRLDRQRDGMVLNFEFAKWPCSEPRKFCVESIAVHEFGHALGFAHEQNRFDAPGECRALAQGTKGDLLLTPYDRESVMNYCNPKYNNGGVLSALDVKAVQEVYGGPAAN